MTDKMIDEYFAAKDVLAPSVGKQAAPTNNWRCSDCKKFVQPGVSRCLSCSIDHGAMKRYASTGRVMCATHEWLDERPCPYCAAAEPLGKQEDAVHPYFHYCAEVRPGFGHCRFKKGHGGKHSWEPGKQEDAAIPGWAEFMAQPLTPEEMAMIPTRPTCQYCSDYGCQSCITKPTEPQEGELPCGFCQQYNHNCSAKLKAELIALRDQLDLARQLDRAKLPCGHLSHYGFTEDGGKTGYCTVCELSALREQLDRAKIDGLSIGIPKASTAVLLAMKIAVEIELAARPEGKELKQCAEAELKVLREQLAARSTVK